MECIAKTVRYLSSLQSWRYTLMVFCVFLQACATPTGDLTRFATQNGLKRSEVRAGGFNLLVFDNETKNRDYASESQGVLHVYLEGDGSPWKYRTIVMPDPTPRNPLMLRLLGYDRSPAVYLGRPCYNGFFNDPGCDDSLWTSGRYSRKVVLSMASAIRALSKRHNARQLWLIGHSGGGTLAMLLAKELPKVTRIVTLAGNLDTDAWTSHHRYTPLFSSINPASAPSLNPNIWQWHLIGGRDTVIPTQLIKPVIMRQASASGFEFPGFNHGCCWERIWPDVLQALSLDMPSRIPGEQFKFRRRPIDS
ncbi:MAG: alpha/beta hydrolase [Granulosicoccus sp.]